MLSALKEGKSHSSLGLKTFELRGGTCDWRGLSPESPGEQIHCYFSNKGRELG